MSSPGLNHGLWNWLQEYDDKDISVDLQGFVKIDSIPRKAFLVYWIISFHSIELWFPINISLCRSVWTGNERARHNSCCANQMANYLTSTDPGANEKWSHKGKGEELKTISGLHFTSRKKLRLVPKKTTLRSLSLLSLRSPQKIDRGCNLILNSSCLSVCPSLTLALCCVFL